MSESPDYRVTLDVYSGPLDLLLFLIRREEVDVYDIPIVKITEQYCQYVEMLRQLDPDAVGEFLVLAATLMEIKSRMLLPRPPEEADDEEALDPRADLVRQLLEYKRFKDAAEHLSRRADEFSRRWPRPPAGLPEADHEVDLEEAELWDLLAAFNRLMLQTGRTGYAHQIVYDDTPVAVHASNILERLQASGGAIEFAAIFAGRSRGECVGLFLALLELIRQRRVRAEQDRPFGQIYVFLLDSRPLTAAEVAEAFGAPAPDAPRERDPTGGDPPDSSPGDEATRSSPAEAEAAKVENEDETRAPGETARDGL